MSSVSPPGTPLMPGAPATFLWPARMLGLCPLLAVSDTLVRALGLGLATVLVLWLSQFILHLLQPRHVSHTAIIANDPADTPNPTAGEHAADQPTQSPPQSAAQRTYDLLLALLVIVTLVSLVDVAMRRYLFALHQSLGIFVPLIASNCLIAYHAFVERRQPAFARSGPSVLADALGMLALFAVVGATRELIGTGGLLAGGWMLGAGMRGDDAPVLVIFDHGFALAGLAPGAFITLGLLVGLTRTLSLRRQRPPSNEFRQESQNDEQD